MKISLTILPGAVIAAIFLLPATARSDSFSGMITDLSGHPLSCVGISLVVAGVATSTDPTGAWSLSSGTTRIVVGPAVNIRSVASHLVLDGNRIRLQFDGVDGAGRQSNAGVGAIHESPLRTPNHAIAARSMDAVSDTLLFAWNGRVRVRVAAVSALPGATQKVDTSTTSADFPWKFSINYGKLTDSRDGQVYRTVTIGTQTWMAENLNFKVDSSWCYNNRADLCSTYGRLYQWWTAMGVSATYNSALINASLPYRGLCPSGWHVPSDAEWNMTDTNLNSSTAGTVLKSTYGWWSNTGTDAYGFRLLPAGYRYSRGAYSDVGGYAYFWSSNAWSRDFSSGYAFVTRGDFDKGYGYSLRCLAD